MKLRQVSLLFEEKQALAQIKRRYDELQKETKQYAIIKN